MSKSAEIIFTNRNRKPTDGLPPQIPDICRVSSIKMLGVTMTNLVSDIAIFVLKRDVKLQLTN